MTFQIRDLTIHLIPKDGNIFDPACTRNSTCPNCASPTAITREKKGGGKKKGGKGGKGKSGGGKKKSLDLLRAQLRDTLAPPPM